MSGVTHPVGPEPPEVYWRRRLIVGLAVIVTLVLLVKVVHHGGGSPAAASSTSTSVSATPAASSGAQMTAQSPSPTASDMPIAVASQTPTAPTTTASGECSDADTAVTITLDRKTTTVGVGVHMTMSVKNTSATSCKRDVGSGANEVTIISGPALIWSTDHCNPSTAKDIVDLKPGQTWSVDDVWDGKMSAKGCKILATAKPGAYWGHARNGNVNSDGASFVIAQ